MQKFRELYMMDYMWALRRSPRAQAWKYQIAAAQFRKWRMKGGEISPRRQELEAWENSRVGRNKRK